MTAARVFGRDVLIVARFELGEAVRSRLLLVMVLLFVGGGSLGAWGYTKLIAKIEEAAAAALQAPTTSKPGAAMKRLRDARSYEQMVRFFVSDEDKARYYADLPPIVVFFGWAAFLFTPWLILFTSAETIAADVASRSIRYSLLRTTRLGYALGKAAGQLVVVLGVTGLCALAFFLVAWAQLAAFEPGITALWLVSYWPRVVIYLLPFLAWSMFASMVSSSANLARVVAMGGAVVLASLRGLTGLPAVERSPVWAPIIDLLAYLSPFGRNDGLSYPPGGQLPADVLVCLALTVLYFAAGFAVLRKRDV